MQRMTNIQMKIKDILAGEGIELFSLVPLKRLKIVKQYLLDKNGFDENANVIMMLFPYRTEHIPENLTVYASVRDYHFFVAELSYKLENYVKEFYPNAKFKVFADHSPIDEVHAACISGLGFIGDNGLLINEKFSSFVFLGECITDLSPSELGLEYAPVSEIKGCLHCGKCKEACPSQCIGQTKDKKLVCLSAITQKKGEFTPEEEKMILENGSIWGCDVCQNVCPYTKNSALSRLPYFNEGVITCLDSSALSSLSMEEFKKRPFAWRGYDVILRNVNLYEKERNHD